MSLMRSLTLRGVHGQSVLLEASTFGRGVPSSLGILGPLAAAHPDLRRQARRVDPAALAAPTVGGRGVLVCIDRAASLAALRMPHLETLLRPVLSISKRPRTSLPQEQHPCPRPDDTDP